MHEPRRQSALTVWSGTYGSQDLNLGSPTPIVDKNLRMGVYLHEGQPMSTCASASRENEYLHQCLQLYSNTLSRPREVRRYLFLGTSIEALAHRASRDLKQGITISRAYRTSRPNTANNTSGKKSSLINQSVR